MILFPKTITKVCSLLIKFYNDALMLSIIPPYYSISYFFLYHDIFIGMRK